MAYCQNCGHDCHCGGKCMQEQINEFNEKYKIECCGNCRHENNKINHKKDGSLDVDSFNGA